MDVIIVLVQRGVIVSVLLALIVVPLVPVLLTSNAGIENQFIDFQCFNLSIGGDLREYKPGDFLVSNINRTPRPMMSVATDERAYPNVGVDQLGKF